MTAGVFSAKRHQECSPRNDTESRVCGLKKVIIMRKIKKKEERAKGKQGLCNLLFFCQQLLRCKDDFSGAVLENPER